MSPKTKSRITKTLNWIWYQFEHKNYINIILIGITAYFLYFSYGWAMSNVVNPITTGLSSLFNKTSEQEEYIRKLELRLEKLELEERLDELPLGEKTRISI